MKLSNLNKKQKIIMISLISFFALLVIGVSFAFYFNLIGDAARTDVDLNADISEKLIFTPGDPISLVASAENFNTGDGNLTGETTSSVTYVPTTGAVNAGKFYNVYFNIENNNFIYTTPDNKPEILLTITDYDNNPVTSIEGLDYVTTTDAATGEEISGFDVTTHTGLIIIKENVQITASAPVDTVHNWNVKLTFVNLTTLQTANEEKTLNASLHLRTEKANFDMVCMNQNMASCFIENKYVVNYLIQHTPEIETSAGDNNYRYSGGNDIVHNYICFGSDEEVCPKDNLYRILGIYNIEGENLVKIIKAHPIDKNKDGMYNVGRNEADTFQFDTGNSNKWEGANTSISTDDADINKYLNTTYINEIPIKYQEMIEPVKLKVGDVFSISSKPKDYYTGEQVATTVQEYKIGLMNVSDYLYGASESNWNLVNWSGDYSSTNDYRDNEEQKANNWMYLSDSSYYYEWTIGPYFSIASTAWHVNSGGYANTGNANIGHGGRPVSYLKSTVVLSSGVGTMDVPFRLS